MEKSDYIFGLRAIIEAIEAGKDIDKVLVKKDINGDLARELLAKAKEYGVLVRRVPVEKLNRITMKNHQGAIAILAAVPYQKLENIIPILYEDGKVPLMVVLDGVTDIRNFEPSHALPTVPAWMRLSFRRTIPSPSQPMPSRLRPVPFSIFLYVARILLLTP